MNKLLKFVNLPQAHAQKRSSSERTNDFGEIYVSYSNKEASKQAGRCSQCGVPTCQVGCPLQNNIPDWLKLAAEGRYEEAYLLSSQTNNFPEICGRICPQDRLCEGSCVIEKTGHEAVTIGDVERFLTDHAWKNNWIKPIEFKSNGKSVAIIGSGPAGLAAASELIAYGYQVHIYDRADRAGGLLIYGIPDFKLEKQIVKRRVEQLERSSVEFFLNCEIGKDKSFRSIYNAYDSVIIATGVYQPRLLDIPSAKASGNIEALDYLKTSNRRILGDVIDPEKEKILNVEGKNVVVVGGGDTAMDCVRTAIRQKAASVHCVYRRDQKSMPGSPAEVKNAMEEGVLFEWLISPKAIELKDNHVCAFVGQKMKLSDVKNGRQQILPISGEIKRYSADVVIHALGFEAEDLPTLFEEDNLELNQNKTIKVQDETLMTSIPGVFTAGDISRGASLVVWAIADGRRAALSTHNWISHSDEHSLK